MKSRRKRKFWKIFCLVCYLGCIGVLIVEACLPGAISSAQSDSASSIVNDNISINEIIEPEKIFLYDEDGNPLPETVSVGGSVACTVEFSPKNTSDQTYTLSVDDPEIADLAKDGTVTFLKAGTVTLTAVSNCEKELTVSHVFTVAVVPLRSIRLSLPQETFLPGDSFAAEAALEPANATDRALCYRVEDEATATVNQDGFVRILSPGRTTLTVYAEADPEISASAELIVEEIPAQAVRLTLQDAAGNIVSGNLRQGESLYLSAKIFPENASDTTLTWSCSPENILSLSGDGNLRRAEGISPGTATVTVCAANGQEASVTVTVEEVPPSVGITIDGKTASEYTFYRGETVYLTADVRPSLPQGAVLEYVFSDPDAVDYDEDTGRLTFLCAGENILQIGFDNGDQHISSSVRLHCKDWQLSGISLSGSVPSASAGTSFQVSAELALPDDFPEELRGKLLAQIVWTSSDQQTATVSGGIVSAIAPGNTVISAEIGDLRSDFDLNVTAPQTVALPDSVEIFADGSRIGSELSLDTGAEIPLDVIGRDETGEIMDLSWILSSSDHSVLLAENGRLIARKAGYATLTVRCTDGGAPIEIAVTVADVPPAHLTFTPEPLLAGDTGRLNRTFSPANTTDQRIRAVSSDPKVLEVDAAGNYRAVSPGAAVVTLVSLADGTVSASGTVFVESNLQALQPMIGGDPADSLTLYVGETLALGYRFETLNGADPYSASVNFKSSGSAVSVDALGHLTGTAEGSATVRLLSADSGVYAEVSVTVIARPANSLSLSLADAPAGDRFLVGDTGRLGISFSPEDTTCQTVTFRSSDPSVLYVSADGRLTAKGAGEAVITAVWTESDAVSASLRISVGHRTGIREILWTGLDFDEDGGGSMVRNGSARIRIVYEKDTTLREASFASSDPEILTVDANGVVTAHRPGKATISISYAEKELTVDVEVRKQRLSDAFSNWTFRIRKALGHFTAFLVLGIFSALTHFLYAEKKWRSIPLSIGVGFGVSALTEWLQSFVPNRTANFADITLNLQGFLCGAAGIFLLLSVAVLIRFFKNRKN